jgi:hypothetical protein
MPRYTVFALLGVVSLAPLAACSKSGDEAVVEVNQAPVAVPSKNTSQAADKAVQLDGRGSYDPEGDTIWYLWSFDSVPADSRLGAATAPFSANNDESGLSSFLPDKVGVYVVKLVVTDGRLESEPVYTVIDATEPDALPVASAGLDQSVAVGDRVSLDGSGSSDPLAGRNGPLTYTWNLVSVPYNSTQSNSALSATDAASIQFTPDAIGDYTLTLVVNNGMSSSVADSVTVSTSGDNAAPTAVVSDDFSGEDCTTTALDCTASTDPDGQPLQYFWELQSKPRTSRATNGSFTDRTAGLADFYPDVAGTYLFSCSVFDGQVWSTPAYVTLTAAERASNKAPIANAGDDRRESGGEVVCEEDGYKYDCGKCKSAQVDLGTGGEASDPDGDPIEITWEIVSGSSTLLGADVFPTQAVLPALEPEEPDACVEEAFEYKLSVRDCPGEVKTDAVKIVNECCGVPSETDL